MSDGLAVALAERGLVPLPLLRRGVRASLAARLDEIEAGGPGAVAMRTALLADQLARSPVAIATEEANAQHYELPPEFFGLVLGARRKYSGCYFPGPGSSLDEAEVAMLELSVERAGVADGMEILELGCGWGSLSLFLAARFPRARILAVSNSAPQRDYIERRAADLGLGNLEVETADMNLFRTRRRFDRVLSIEMFEHMRNWPLLFSRIASWLTPAGKLFLHVFCHRDAPYLFEQTGRGDWMARHFFTGGLMPTPALVRRFDRDLEVVRQWEVDGGHYARTARAWHENLERRRTGVMPILRTVYGAEAARWYGRWRLFFLACEELFAHGDGRDWFVSHSLLSRR